MTALLAASSPQVGDLAPDFTVTTVDGNRFVLRERLQRGPVVLAFFPKAFTGGCTREVEAYQAEYAEFERAGAQVLLVSADDVETLHRFRAQYGPRLSFTSDATGNLMGRYGVKAPVLTLALRTTFVINTEGRVVAVFSGGDAIEVRPSLDALHSSPAPATSRPAATGR